MHMYIWKNLKPYYKFKLSRIMYSQAIHLNNISTTFSLSLSVDKNFKTTHLMYLALVSRGSLSHLIRFFIPRKLKRQSNRLKGIRRGFCRVTYSENWRLIYKLYLSLYNYAAQEYTGLNLNNTWSKITYYDSSKSPESTVLKSFRGFYVNTPVTWNILLDNYDFTSKIFYFNLTKFISLAFPNITYDANEIEYTNDCSNVDVSFYSKYDAKLDSKMDSHYYIVNKILEEEEELFILTSELESNELELDIW